MSKTRQTVSINVPFSGFYESIWSGELDHAEEQWCEYEAAERDDGELQHPEELRLSSEELAELLYWAAEYGTAHALIAKDYVEAFDYQIGELLGLTKASTRTRFDYSTTPAATRIEPCRDASLHLTYETMTSPREYNFETDRLFADIPLAVMYLLFRRSRAEGHKTLAAMIADRFTSYDGFRSHYANELASWLEKPLADWDHNELATLLGAAMEMAGADDDWRWSIYYSMSENNSFDDAFQAAVDWAKFEAAREEKREEKRSALLESDPEMAEKLASYTPRCTETPDMFR